MAAQLVYCLCPKYIVVLGEGGLVAVEVSSHAWCVVILYDGTALLRAEELTRK